jgi:hypothetical protein
MQASAEALRLHDCRNDRLVTTRDRALAPQKEILDLLDVPAASDPGYGAPVTSAVTNGAV